MITSASNEKIKHVAKLVKSSADRRREGVFVVEGDRICSEVPSDRYVEGYVSESYLEKNNIKPSAGGDVCLINGVNYTIVSNAVYKKISDTVSGQGIMCVVKQKKVDPVDFIDEYEDTGVKLLILENIQDPGNLGTMIRTAEAAGYDAIITDRNTVDVYNPKVIRSTMGGIFRMPVMVAEDLMVFLEDARIRGIKLYGAILEGSVDYRECDYSDRMGVLIGNEGNGLSREAQSMVDNKIRIPMEGKVESLNAAVAAAIIMYRTMK